jgi:hypothetical protein
VARRATSDSEVPRMIFVRRLWASQRQGPHSCQVLHHLRRRVWTATDPTGLAEAEPSVCVEGLTPNVLFPPYAPQLDGRGLFYQVRAASWIGLRSRERRAVPAGSIAKHGARTSRPTTASARYLRRCWLSSASAQRVFCWAVEPTPHLVQGASVTQCG